MIVSLHVATGAAVGALAGSRKRALLLGAPAHMLGDWMPHRDIPSLRFEVVSGAACLALLGATRGPFDRVTLGAAAAAAPDLEHVFRSLRIGGRKTFHGRLGWHRAGAFPAAVQLVVAGAIVGFLLGPRRDA